MQLTKPQLRTDMKARRTAMSTEQVADASDAICRRVLELEDLRDAESIFCFVSIRNEPDTRNLIHDLLDMDKQVCVPRLDTSGQMHAHRILSLSDLTPSGGEYFHIPAPPADAPIEPHPEITLIPGLAFTQTGQRLGMGGGHYDRYLADHPDTLPIGLCYDWQVLDTLPSEPHDRPMRMIVTDSRVISCGD
jgi:5-formyltetrahydrofolate cyclo-ligase